MGALRGPLSGAVRGPSRSAARRGGPFTQRDGGHPRRAPWVVQWGRGPMSLLSGGMASSPRRVPAGAPAAPPGQWAPLDPPRRSGPPVGGSRSGTTTSGGTSSEEGPRCPPRAGHRRRSARKGSDRTTRGTLPSSSRWCRWCRFSLFLPPGHSWAPLRPQVPPGLPDREEGKGKRKFEAGQLLPPSPPRKGRGGGWGSRVLLACPRD